MVNGLHTASRSMLNIMAKQDLHAQNLANSTTTGFKLSRLVNRTEVAIGRDDKQQLHQDEDQVVADRVQSFQQGPMLKTGNSLDFALTTPGFFAVEGGEDGLPRYTRNGTFAVNTSGELVTLTGKRVLDDAGSPIQLSGEGAVQLMEDGGLFKDGKRVARLGVTAFERENRLVPGGDGLYSNPDPALNPPRAAETVGVRQGFLEGSNVDPIATMVHMMSEFRNYEANQKVVQAIDSTLGKAVNEVGRV
jgi:flagellar basal-body rod protein FlgG